MRNFKDLEVWKLGFDPMIKVYRIASELPREEKYGLSDQVRRAFVSIPSNISEGCSRSDDLDFKRSLEIALGSTFELETQLLAIEKLNSGQVGLQDTFEQLDLLQKKLNALITANKNRLPKK